MPRIRANTDGGNIYPKHSTIGYKGTLIPPNSHVGRHCLIMNFATVGGRTTISDGVKVRKGVEFGSHVWFGRDARVRGTKDDQVLFGAGITFDDGAELRHCFFPHGVRFLGSALIEHCVLPSDVVFSDRQLIDIVRCKKLAVEEPFDWTTAQPDGEYSS
jgi:NDP-sugar pyrophosphorylase family protein